MARSNWLLQPKPQASGTLSWPTPQHRDTADNESQNKSRMDQHRTMIEKEKVKFGVAVFDIFKTDPEAVEAAYQKASEARSALGWFSYPT